MDILSSSVTNYVFSPVWDEMFIDLKLGDYIHLLKVRDEDSK